MGPITTFRDLEVWQIAMELVVTTYRITDFLPDSERYGLSSQMRRAAVSIPANLAERHARRSDRANLNHLNIALGSQAELDTELELARRLRFLTPEHVGEITRLMDRVRPMLHGLRRSLEARHRAKLAASGTLVLGTLATWASIGAVLN